MHFEWHCIANLNVLPIYAFWQSDLYCMQSIDFNNLCIPWESNAWPWLWHALKFQLQEYYPNNHDFETLHMWFSLNVKVSQKSPKGSRWRYFSHNYALLVWSCVFPERTELRSLQRVVHKSQTSLWPILNHSERAKRAYPTALDGISLATMPNEMNQS